MRERAHARYVAIPIMPLTADETDLRFSGIPRQTDIPAKKAHLWRQKAAFATAHPLKRCNEYQFYALHGAIMSKSAGNTRKFTLMTEQDSLKFSALINYVDELSLLKDLSRYCATPLDEWDEYETDSVGLPVAAFELIGSPSSLVGQGDITATSV